MFADTQAVSVSLPREALRHLRVEAANQDMSRHQLLRQIVLAWLISHLTSTVSNTPV
jgi:hypothetical protein